MPPSRHEAAVLPAYSPDYNPVKKSRANMKRALIDIIPTAVYQYFGVDIS
jgi:transposase